VNRDEDFSNFEFVGKKLDDVKHFYHLNYRVMIEDGNAYCGTCDVVRNRYNFAVDNGVITSVWMG
jgi:hypothetical protein